MSADPTATTTTPGLDKPKVPRGRVTIQTPPEIQPDDGAGGVLSSMVPMLGSLGAIIMLVTRDSGPAGLMTGGMFLMSSLGFVAVNGWRQRAQRTQAMIAARREYLAYIADLRKTVRRAATAQRQAALWATPHPSALVVVAEENSRVWTRGPGDEDFLRVRVGLSEEPLCLDLEPAEIPPLSQLDPVAASTAHRFILANETLRDIPVTVQLASLARMEIVGDDGDALRALARSVIAQAATWHGPETLRIAVIRSPELAEEWDWVADLPHAASDKYLADGTPAALIATNDADILSLLPAEIGERGIFTPQIHAVVPHVLVVVDGGHVDSESHLVTREGTQGVTVLDLPESWGELFSPLWARCSVEVSSVTGTATVEVARITAPTQQATADRFSIVEAKALAARLIPTEAGGVVAESRQVSSELTDLLGIPDIRSLDFDTIWRHKPTRERLRVPIGLAHDGQPLMLDLKESAEQGMGPHGIIIGATGSGKSEVLRTLVLALALDHSPEQLNFVLVDFKGGATFAGMADMPHVSAIITNLGEEIALVDRMQEALQGEMVRRQELLRAAGNFANVSEYEKARRTGRDDLEPLPALLIVADEFSELLAAKPEFVDTFVNIGRLGRSLQVHLLMSSQRLEEGKLRGLDSHLSYRIGLRTFSAAESRSVLGVPDAYELPSIPGVGYLKPGPGSLERFRASYVSGPPPQDPGSTTSTFMYAVNQMRGRGPLAHTVWLPPLEQANTLDEFMPDLAADPELGYISRTWREARQLTVPIALVDRPLEQRRELLSVDLSGAGGHLAIVGGPLSGKSTALRTLVTALALTRTPLELQVFILDFGGGSFVAMNHLAHVAGVATRSDPDVVRRTVAEVTALLNARERYFRAEQIDSMETYRRRRAAGAADDGYGEIFLVIDGWTTLRSEFEDLESAVQEIAARGLTFGIHLAISASRWADVRPATKDLIGTRLELLLGDPGESEIDRKAAKNVPTSAPGRGLTPQAFHMLTALPRVDGSSDPGTLSDGIADLIERVGLAWRGPQPPKLRLLPERITHAELLDRVPESASGSAFWLGIDEAELSPVAFDPIAEPHLFLYGDSGTGKSSFLRLIAAEIARTYSSTEAKIFAIDLRRALLGEIPADHEGAYLTSHDMATSGINDIAAYLKTRLPGPDVTPQQLRDRSWWSGAEAFVLVDDYDLVATSQGNPLAPLVPFLAQATDIGLHVIVTRRMGGASRAAYDPVIQTFGDLGVTGILLPGNPEEGAVIGRVRPKPGVAGRVQIVSRRATIAAQLAYLPPTLS